MLSVVDVLGLLAQKGSLTMDELEQARGSDLGRLWVVVDVCIEEGILDCKTDDAGILGTYSLTQHGRRLLDLAGAGVAAA